MTEIHKQDFSMKKINGVIDDDYMKVATPMKRVPSAVKCQHVLDEFESECFSDQECCDDLRVPEILKYSQV